MPFKRFYPLYVGRKTTGVIDEDAPQLRGEMGRQRWQHDDQRSHGSLVLEAVDQLQVLRRHFLNREKNQMITALHTMAIGCILAICGGSTTFSITNSFQKPNTWNANGIVVILILIDKYMLK